MCIYRKYIIELIVLARVVEQTGPRMFGIEEDELLRRRKYVGQVRQEVNVR